MPRVRVRRRRPYAAIVSMKRPIDKVLYTNNATITPAVAAYQLYATSFPGTLTGLRWKIKFLQSAATANYGQYYFMIKRDGIADPSALTWGGTPVAPEQNVLGMGLFAHHANNTMTYEDSGEVKTQRKLMGGDKFMLYINCAAGATTNFYVQVQFFIKS